MNIGRMQWGWGEHAIANTHTHTHTVTLVIHRMDGASVTDQTQP